MGIGVCEIAISKTDSFTLAVFKFISILKRPKPSDLRHLTYGLVTPIISIYLLQI